MLGCSASESSTTVTAEVQELAAVKLLWYSLFFVIYTLTGRFIIRGYRVGPPIASELT